MLPRWCERDVQIAPGDIKILQRRAFWSRRAVIVRRGEPGSLVGAHVVDPEELP
jgi:hypothetical protein